MVTQGLTGKGLAFAALVFASLAQPVSGQLADMPEIPPLAETKPETKPETKQPNQEVKPAKNKPRREVEIEAQFVEIGTSDLKAFRMNFPYENPNGFSLGYVRNPFRATLWALVEYQKRARVITAPVIKALNNKPATISLTDSIPVAFGPGGLAAGNLAEANRSNLSLTVQLGVTVTPNVNNDDTVTLGLRPLTRLQLNVATPGSPRSDAAPEFIGEIYTNIRDGDTLALAGLRTRTLRKGNQRISVWSYIPGLGEVLSGNDSEPEREVIIFVTPRIIHRVEDTAPLPGN
ncbi:MAG: hypothetical protein M3347_01685 [Armatimonadota bacterium]|nr:hypothetical protein [Armatimonadota bacterium]